jgi:hypothetical protein
MDEIRIWDRALSAEEINTGLPKRSSWGTPNLIALVNAETNRVKSINGKEVSAMFRGALTWKVQGRSSGEVSRKLNKKSIKVVFPPEIYSLSNKGILVKIDQGVSYGQSLYASVFDDNQFTTNVAGILNTTLNIQWLPDQFPTNICLYTQLASGDFLAAVPTVKRSASGLSLSNFDLVRFETSVLVENFKGPVIEAIRQGKEVNIFIKKKKFLLEN